jgi:basic amino acid/polyamine antiporter, APA family
MSSTAGTRQVPQPPGDKARPAAPAGQGASLGLLSATGLVIGTIVGVGVFTMPAVLASAGTCSLVVLAVVSVGAMALAVVFGQLTRRVPNSDGGLYAYARHEFGDFAGYVTHGATGSPRGQATRPSPCRGCST